RANRHQAGHLVLGELDLLAAEGGERNVSDLVRFRTHALTPSWDAGQRSRGYGIGQPRRTPKLGFLTKERKIYGMRISEAAKRLGMSPRMLRYREDLGLLPPLRDRPSGRGP